MTLEALYQIIKQRQQDMPADSYVAKLFAQGRDRIIQKVGEEAVEVVIAAKNGSKTALINETCDLLFHTLVMLADQQITMEELFKVLQTRHKTIIP